MKRQKQDSRNTLQRLFKHLLLSLTFILLIFNSASALVHPGGWLTQDELTLIRDKVSAQEQPWYDAWKDMENQGANTNYSASVATTITNQGIFQADGHAAYELAIKWVASGNGSYATTAINIINDWVNHVEGFNHGNTPLRQGIAANKMAQAAEILAHGFNGGSGWSSFHIGKARRWFIDVVYPVTSTGGSRSMNWGTSALAGNMSMAIFCDNNTMFDDAVDAYKNGFSNTNDGCTSVTDYIINSAGQCYESGRDQAHAQGGIAHLVETALSAWNQGTDLVSHASNRLVAGMEYTAKYNLNNSVSWTSNIPNRCNLNQFWPNGISTDDRGHFSPIYIMASSLFTRAGKLHPYTAQVITDTGEPNNNDFNGYDQPESSNSDHPGLGTLTHTTGPIVRMRKRNALLFSLDAGHGGSNGANVKLYSEDNSNVNQQWIEINRGNGFYSYQKNGTKYCLDGGNNGANGNNVKLWTCSSTQQNQHWKKISKGGSFYRLEKRNSSSFSIDGGNNGANNNNVYMWSNGNGNNQNQQWAFSELSLNGARLLQEDLEENLEIGLENLELTVYPNPVLDQLTVNTPSNQYNQFSIYNIGGKVVVQDQIANDVTELSIDLKKLNGGVYVLELKGETAVKKIKLLKN